MNVQNRLSNVVTAVKNGSDGRETGTIEFISRGIMATVRSLTAACSTVELLRNGSLEF